MFGLQKQDIQISWPNTKCNFILENNVKNYPRKKNQTMFYSPKPSTLQWNYKCALEHLENSEAGSCRLTS